MEFNTEADSLTEKARRISKNTTFLLLQQIGGLLISFAFTVYAARFLGAVEFGGYYFAVAFVSSAGILASLGLPKLLFRDVARRPQDAPEELSHLLPLGVLSTLLVIVGLQLIIKLFPQTSQAERLLVLLLSIAMLPGLLTQLVYAIFNGLERMGLPAVMGLLFNAVTTGLNFYVLYRWQNVAYLGWVAIGVQALGVFVALYLLRRVLDLPWPKLRLDLRRMAAAAREAYPFALGLFLILLYPRLPVFMLKKYAAPEELGYYSVAWSVTRGLSVLPSVFLQALFPEFCRAYTRGQQALGRVSRHALGVLLSIMLPGVALFIVVSRPVVLTLFGEQYAAATGYLQILAWYIVSSTIAGVFLRALDASENQFGNMVVAGVVTGLAVPLNAVAAINWGARGCAFVTAMVPVLLGVGRWMVAKRARIAMPVMSTIGRFLLPATLLFSAMYIKAGPSWLLPTVGFIGFVVLTWTLVLQPAERETFKKIISHRILHLAK